VNNTVNVSSSWFNTSTYTFTPQKAGYWEITAAYDVYRLNNVESAMAIKKNNGIVVTTGAFGAVAQQVIKIVHLNGSTDFINVVNVGGAANSRPQYEGRSWFQARWVGE
jgi:putative exporter of polyketide antibiotics